MLTYPIGDLLIRIKNAALAGNHEVVVDATKQKVAVAKALKQAGFLENISIKEKILTVKLAFWHKKPVLIDLKLVSTPGRRIYLGVKEIASKRGPSVFLISTPKGIFLSKEALKMGLGGEVIAQVW